MKKMPTFLIIAGTVYGRKLSYELCDMGAVVYATVATEYGEDIFKPYDNLTVLSGRLTIPEMEELITQLKPDVVINTAHPYAVIVSENIKAACQSTNTYYLRLIRDEAEAEGVKYVKDLEEGAKYLSFKNGNVFSSCGSKEMSKLTAISEFRERVFLRALPDSEFIKNAVGLGFAPSNLICMQGPFSKELNIAMLKAVNAKYLITKSSGSAGGFNEKVEAAKELGIEIIVLGRPIGQSGYYYEDLKAKLIDEFKLYNKIAKADNPHYFPMFISLNNKNIKVFGGGSIAKRRIETLKIFGCNICVIAPEIKFTNIDGIEINKKEYEEGDCIGADLIIAATDNPQVNRQIALECKKNNIPVSVCDDKSLCTFYFPSVIIEDDIVIGVTSSGKDHKKLKNTADNIRKNIDLICGG